MRTSPPPPLRSDTNNPTDTGIGYSMIIDMPDLSAMDTLLNPAIPAQPLVMNDDHGLGHLDVSRQLLTGKSWTEFPNTINQSSVVDPENPAVCLKKIYTGICLIGEEWVPSAMYKDTRTDL